MYRQRMLYVAVIGALVAFNFSLFADVIMITTGSSAGSITALPTVPSTLPDTVTLNESIIATTSNFTHMALNTQPFQNSSDAAINNIDKNNNHIGVDLDNTANTTNNNKITQASILSEINDDVSSNISSLAACLLVKDENDSLNEWIAYHYHLWNLRRLVIAVDPTSQTSPRHLLDQWEHHFQLKFVLWEEADYMPRDYSVFKFRLGKILEKNPHRNFTDEEKQTISNHNNRQREFLRLCYRYFDEDQQAAETAASEWIVHIDVDEYLSWNPWLLEQESSTTTVVTRNQSLFPPLAIQQPTAGAMMKIFQEYYPDDNPSSCCVLVPRLLFGGVENDDPTNNRTLLLPAPWNGKSFETMRWKYHAPLVAGGPHNGPPKAMLNWKLIRKRPRHRQMLLKDGVLTIHRPSKYLCPKDVSFDARYPSEKKLSLLGIRHFLGSLEKYMSRQDARRSIESYYQKANLTDGPIMDSAIDHWLQQFVNDHGFDKVTQVLGRYRLDAKDCSNGSCGVPRNVSYNHPSRGSV